MPHARLFVVQRPANRRASVAAHLPAVLISGGLLLAAALLPASGLPGSTCLLLNLTELPCPLCGMTRAFIAMAHARWHEAWVQSPLAAILFVATLVLFAVQAAALSAGVVVSPGGWLVWNKRTGWILAAVVTAAVAFNWIYRLKAGLH